MVKNHIFQEGKQSLILATIPIFTTAILFSKGKHNIAVIGFMISIIFLAFLIFFFRDPDIDVAIDNNIILSPASGKIFFTSNYDATNYKSKWYYRGDYKESDFTDPYYHIIKIHLRPYDNHIQRAPVSGSIVNIENLLMDYDLERTRYTIKTNDGLLVMVDQVVKKIAKGPTLMKILAATRNVPWVKVGDIVNQGDKLGMIRFGSQCTLYIPKKHYEIKIKVSDRVKVGETIIAHRIIDPIHKK